MKVTQITHLELEDIVSSVLNYPLDLPKLEYFRFEVNSITYFSISSKIANLGTGLVIMEKRNDQIRLLPSIIEFLSGLPVVQLKSFEDTKRITHGKTVEYNTEFSLMIVIDYFERVIALCKSSSTHITPIVDVGFYLREE